MVGAFGRSEPLKSIRRKPAGAYQQGATLRRRSAGDLEFSRRRIPGNQYVAKDRNGRAIDYGELTHYQKVIVALNETICLTDTIDDLVPGWPVN